jgi:hypothetical protein
MSDFGLQKKDGTVFFLVDEILWERVLSFVEETGYDGDVWSDER